MAQGRPDVQFTLIGDGPPRKTVESRVQALDLGGADRGWEIVAEAIEIKDFERFKIVPLEK